MTAFTSMHPFRKVYVEMLIAMVLPFAVSCVGPYAKFRTVHVRMYAVKKECM